MKLLNKFVLLTVITGMIACNQQQTKEKERPTQVSLIDREILFGNAERSLGRISPDGKYVSFTAEKDGVLNVYVAPIDEPDKAEVVTNDTLRGIRSYQWTYKDDHLLYIQDEGGDENWAVHLVNVKTKQDANLTPFDRIIGPDDVPIKLPSGKLMRPRATILNVSQQKPDEILIRLNKDNPQYMDVYAANLETGDLQKVVADNGFVQLVSDNSNNIILGSKNNEDGSLTVMKYIEPGKWEDYFNVPKEDVYTFGIIGTNKDDSEVYMLDSRGRNTAALVSLNLETDEKTILAADDKSDIQGATIDPVDYTVEAVVTDYLRQEWKILDEELKDDFEYLETLKDGDISILSRTENDGQWMVAISPADGPWDYFLYDKENMEGKFLFSNRPELKKETLANMYPLEIPSRDGKTLVSYLTLPVTEDVGGKPEKPLPMVLWVHGGPWARDNYGYNSIHQWLANRGYAVLSVNYRGSTGFGKDFINAAIKEWAGAMHDDLLDAVNYAVENGIAQEDKIAIGGGSYGGYATLVGLTFTPDVFACGVDIVGPSNLNTLLNAIPPYWKAFFETMALHVGDPRTEEGKALLEERSPLTYVDSIRKPLLIGQGANDPRVKQAEADQIVEVMKEKEIPVTYVLYPDEGHGFARPENRLSFFAVMEKFLAENLGGRAQDIGDDFDNSSIEVPAGSGHVSGLTEALAKDDVAVSSTETVEGSL